MNNGYPSTTNFFGRVSLFELSTAFQVGQQYGVASAICLLTCRGRANRMDGLVVIVI